ncbi:Electron transfer flavoprotein alpha-subunit [Tulasnella sp. 427]|nr:Electron transfer flavoprotein alpha-subunit [Tulasnella sp. 427]
MFFHNDGVINAGTLSALTAASKLGGEVTGLAVGAPEAVKDVVEKAQNSSYTHLAASHSTTAKSLLPRVAAQLDVPAAADVMSVEQNADGSTTFERPIYAGNAISTAKAPSSIPVKVFTVRGTAFDKAATDGPEVPAEEVKAVEVADSLTEHLKTSLTQSDRPELGTASKVVSGGRALKSAELFDKTLHPLADVLGAAIARHYSTFYQAHTSCHTSSKETSTLRRNQISPQLTVNITDS